MNTYRIQWHYVTDANLKAVTVLRAEDKRHAHTILFNRLGLSHRNHDRIRFRTERLDDEQFSLFE